MAAVTDPSHAQPTANPCPPYSMPITYATYARPPNATHPPPVTPTTLNDTSGNDIEFKSSF